jgi:hypothetical protein
MAMNKQIKNVDIGDYIIYENGDVYSKKKNIILRQQFDGNGYFQVGLFVNKINKKYKVHRLIAENFIPNPFQKPMVNHKNGIKSDNRICNLEWVTNKENTVHAAMNGLTTNKHSMKPVIDLYTGVFYESATELSKVIGMNKYTLMGKLAGYRKKINRYVYA